MRKFIINKKWNKFLSISLKVSTIGIFIMGNEESQPRNIYTVFLENEGPIRERKIQILACLTNMVDVFTYLYDYVERDKDDIRKWRPIKGGFLKGDTFLYVNHSILDDRIRKSSEIQLSDDVQMRLPRMSDDPETPIEPKTIHHIIRTDYIDNDVMNYINVTFSESTEAIDYFLDVIQHENSLTLRDVNKWRRRSKNKYIKRDKNGNIRIIELQSFELESLELTRKYRTRLNEFFDEIRDWLFKWGQPLIPGPDFRKLRDDQPDNGMFLTLLGPNEVAKAFNDKA